MKAVYKVCIGLFLSSAEIVVRFLTELCSWFGVDLMLGRKYPGILLTDGLKTFGLSTVQSGLSGDFIGIEFPITIIGLCLTAWGCFELRQYHKRFTMAAGFALGTSVSYIGMKVIPLFTPTGEEIGIYGLIVLILVKILLESAMLFSIARAMGRQVDSYLYMELEQDLQFAFQLYVISSGVTYILSVFRAIDLVQIFFMKGCLGCLGACFYYSIRMYHYTKKLKLFAA